MRFEWNQDTDGGFRAAIGDITLYVTPDRSKRGKPARGTTWRAGVSIWCEATKTISRYGRDVYSQQVAKARDAMRLAESVYTEATP